MNNRYNVPATVKGHALALSSQRQTPSVKIVLQTNDESPRTLYKDLWLSDGAFDGSITVLREVLGWQGMDLAELNAQPAILDGVEVVAVVEVKSYEHPDTGEVTEREEVAFLNSPGSGGVKPLEAAQASVLVRSLNARLTSMGRSAGATASKAPTPSRAPATGRAGRPAPSSAPGVDDFAGYAPPDDGAGTY